MEDPNRVVTMNPDQVSRGSIETVEGFEAVTNKNKFVNAAANVHGADFWKKWVEYGGDMDAYVKENMPSYALVGALLVSFSYGYVIEPPGGMNELGTSWFIILMNIATMLNVFLVLLSVTVYAQFCSCVSRTTRMTFTAKFGFLVPVCAFTVVFIIVILMGAALIPIYQLSLQGGVGAKPATFWVSLGVVVLFGVLTAFCALYLPTWNQTHNYLQVLEQDHPLTALAKAAAGVDSTTRAALEDANCSPEFLKFLASLTKVSNAEYVNFIEALTAKGVDQCDATKVVFELKNRLELADGVAETAIDA